MSPDETKTATGCARCGGSAIDPEDSFTGSYGGWIEEPPALEPCRDCVHPHDTTTPTFRPGDRVRTLPTDDETPVGSLGTITDHYPRRPGFLEGYGVRLDNDPTGLSAHYDAHEIELADADRARILRIVADWAYRSAEYGGLNAGDLLWELEHAGFHLLTTTEETHRG